MQYEGEYICDACGETIVIPIDASAGSSQDYVEDCPVCCHPNEIRVDLDADGEFIVTARAEQDRY
ncbi:MAG: CPXCG motif-containing cysteine-rich protein [Planctomycetota bacterium]